VSAKVVAKCFWHREVEDELNERGLREKWVFKSEQTDDHTGNYDHFMEYVDRKRSEELYSHNCSMHCRQKGEWLYFSEVTQDIFNYITGGKAPSPSAPHSTILPPPQSKSLFSKI
jgi:hypothetical protein